LVGWCAGVVQWTGARWLYRANIGEGDGSANSHRGSTVVRHPRGLCAGCLVHHKLVDNLNLVVEYDLRNDIDHLRPYKKTQQLHTWRNEMANLTWRKRYKVEFLNEE
ncbi:hypothetical protein Taro_009048, partial [Colocasia esculenta]|nr:hypothetical protein [Colocasia esculenta]